MPSAQELEEQLKAQREALAQSVDDLAERVNPKAQAKEKAEQVRAKAAEAGSSISESLHQFGFIAKEMSEGVRAQAKYYWDRAGEGDSSARVVLATVGAGALLVGGAVVKKIFKH